eukprot:1181967-Rhodomonas_salina.1
MSCGAPDPCSTARIPAAMVSFEGGEVLKLALALGESEEARVGAEGAGEGSEEARGGAEGPGVTTLG